MNKRVYLFELDSVRSTDEEILIGQKALHDELFNNGNTIILSMNQITDSKAILCMLYNQTTYEILRSYLTKGLIRISRYGTVRTTSQYLQNAINKNLSKNHDVFIFSALPVKSNQKKLLLLMREVLVNSDLSAIKDYTDGMHRTRMIHLFDEYADNDQVKENTVTEEQAKEYLTILYRFLELVLLISMYDESSNPAIEYSDDYQVRKFLDYMNSILSFQEPEQNKELWEMSKRNLCELKSIIDSKSNVIQNRSVWIRKLYEKSKHATDIERSALQYTEMIVNLCYNYTVEYSIFGSSKHYKRNSLGQELTEGTFQEEFFSRLSYDWNNGISPNDRFLREESNIFYEYKGELPNWKKSNRIIERRIREEKQKESEYKEQFKGVSLYEYEYHKKRKETRREDTINIFKVILTAFIYVTVMILMDRLMSTVEDLIGEVIKSSVTFIAIMMVGALIDRISPSSDIIECGKMFLMSLTDFALLAKQKVHTYINYRNLKIDDKESLPAQAMQEIYQDKSLKEYKQLAEDRNELFTQSDILEILDPRVEEDEKEILAYEMVHNVKIGINYKSKFHMLVVDLIRGKDGKLFTYERLIPIVPEGAVVVIPKYQGKYILLSQFRHSMREMQLGFPRGFGEFDQKGQCLNGEKNALKEICEELGIAQDKVSHIEKLGQVIADSGVSGNKVSVYQVEVTEFVIRDGYEGIQSILLKSEEELDLLIKEKQVNDGFTLAAWSLFGAEKAR